MCFWHCSQQNLSQQTYHNNVFADREDPQSAPIPELHKALFRLAELFVKRSWQATSADLNDIRAAGASDHDLADWLQIASIQTWFTNSADAGGIPLEGDAVTGPVLARERSFYHSQPTAKREPPPPQTAGSDLGWLPAPCAGDRYEAAERWGLDHYGLTPNLFKAISACPDFYPRHQLALELLDRPQSESVSNSLHALTRATVIALNHSSYFEPTARELLSRETVGVTSLDTLRASPDENIDDTQLRVVLKFVHKMAKNSYKITGKDAESFRNAGLTDEAYVEIFNTVAIQQSLDRLANCIGVAADAQPLLDRT